jgi:predicted nucleotide-binding protein
LKLAATRQPTSDPEASGSFGKRSRKVREFPADSLEVALKIATAIGEHNAGRPYYRLSLAESIGRKPDSSAFRSMITSSGAYGLTKGSFTAPNIELTPLGQAIVMPTSDEERRTALIDAVLKVPVYTKLAEHFRDAKLPSPEILRNTLIRQFGISHDTADECAQLFAANGRFVGLVRMVSGADRVLSLEAIRGSVSAQFKEDVHPDEERFEEPLENETDGEHSGSQPANISNGTPNPAIAPAVFVGHGKKHQALAKVETLLSGFKIPFHVAKSEPNLARPIPTKVRETMKMCTSAILIFTKDECFFDDQGGEVWRPSENVVFELGAASFLYEDRIVILMEKGLKLPSNFSSIGHIEFEIESFESRTMDVVKELVGLGLLKITPA